MDEQPNEQTEPEANVKVNVWALGGAGVLILVMGALLFAAQPERGGAFLTIGMIGVSEQAGLDELTKMLDEFGRTHPKLNLRIAVFPDPGDVSQDGPMVRLLYEAADYQSELAEVSSMIAPYAARWKVKLESIDRKTTPAKFPLGYMMWGKAKEVDEQEKQFRDFELLNPDISVRVINVTGQYQVKLATMLAGDLAPDMFMMHANQFPFLADRKLVMPLDDFIDNDSDVDLTAFYPSAIRACQYKPAWSDKSLMFRVPAGGWSVVVFYNKDMFDQAQLNYPADDWTWDDFYAASKKLTKTGADGKIEVFGTWGSGPWWTYIMYMLQNGGEMFDEEGHLVIGHDKYIDQNVEALNFCAKLILGPNGDGKGQVQPSEGQQEGMPADAFKAGKVAMKMSGTWHINQMIDFKAFRWDIAPPPRKVKPATLVGFGSAMISAKSKYPQACWRIMKYFMSRTHQRSIARQGQGLPARMDVAKEYHNLIKGIPADVQLHKVYDVMSYGQPIYIGTEISNIMDTPITNLRDRILMGSVKPDAVRGELKKIQKQYGSDAGCKQCQRLH